MKKCFSRVLTGMVGVGIGFFGHHYLSQKKGTSSGNKEYKFRTYYNLLDRWLMLLHSGKTISQYLKEQGYQKIAIYGMGEIGDRLYEQLADSDIEICYVLDKNAAALDPSYEIRSLDDDLEEVDAILVTAIFAYDDIEKELKKKVSYPIISLEDIIYAI